MESMQPVRPVSPVAPYIGGKSRLAADIIRVIEAIPHQSYCECFVGMGGVFLRRRLRPKAEVINDYSRDVSTLFRVLQRHYQAFADMIKWQLATRADFDRLMQTDPNTLTDLERAARFLYLQRLAFGGKVAGRSFGVTPLGSSRFDVPKLMELLPDIHARMSSVTIENMDYADFIRTYDRPPVLFYLDPPYYGSEGDYGAALFNRDRFQEMAALLANIQGTFLLSLNDCPGVRDVFGQFHMITLKTTYTVGGSDKAQDVQEVLISNRDLTTLPTGRTLSLF